jgi:ubiquinone/menaquinone biosynthesis C-methylase UbiE
LRPHLDWPITDEPDIAAEYDLYAGVYDLLFRARGDDLDFYVDRIRGILPVGGEILELGTGTGRMAERMVEAGFKVTGVDFSRAMRGNAASASDSTPSSPMSALWRLGGGSRS